jgi:hypothetical protein
MGFHKYGAYSFSTSVQKMSMIGGDSFVADITALRLHNPSGMATILDVPVIAEQYGSSAQEAEGRAVRAMNEWLAANQPGVPLPVEMRSDDVGAR